MAADELHRLDEGFTFYFTAKDGVSVIDISACTVKAVLFRAPSGTVFQKDGTFIDGGANGEYKYKTTNGIINETGPWHLQGYLEHPAWKLRSDMHKFRVHEALEVTV